MNKVFNVGLIGAGRIGKIHAQNIDLNPQLALHSVSDPMMAAATELAEQYKASVISIEEVFSNDAVDLLIIASPTNTHADFIELASQNGKPSLCEKPIDNDPARASQCIEKLRQQHTHCSMGFNRRHDPLFQQLNSDLSSGKIGELEMLVITSRDPSPPPVSYIKTSGGLFKDMSIHDLDVARWLLNETIIEVHATGSNLVDKAIGQAGDIDTAMITLKTQSGKLCHINNSRRAVYGYDQRIEAFGSAGMLCADNVRHSQLVTSTANGSEQQPLLDFFLERYEQAYKNELQDFIDSVTENRQPLVTPHDGLMALNLAEAAQESLDSSRSITVNC